MDHGIIGNMRSATVCCLLSLLCSALATHAAESAGPGRTRPDMDKSGGMLTVDDYSSGIFAGGFSDPGSTIQVTSTAGDPAPGLLVSYSLKPDGWVGIWHQVGMAWNRPQDWTGLKRIVLSVKSSEPISFVPAIQFSKEVQCQGAGMTTAGTGWETMSIPASAFSQLPSPVGEVMQLLLRFNTAGEHQVAIGWIAIERDPQAAADWVDLHAFKNLIPPASAPASRRTFHVSNGGDDGGPGSEAAPWRTIQHGVEALSPGDTLLVHAGTYVESADGDQAGVLIRRSGLPNAPITIAAAPGDRPRVSSATWGAFRIQDSSHVVISGFDVTTTPITFEGRTVSVGNGVMVERSAHIQVMDNICHDCGGGGIGCIGSDYISIIGNKTFRNAYTMKWQASGISLYQCRDLDREPGTHNFILRNESYLNENRTPTDSGELTDGNGIIVDDGFNSQGSGPHIAYKGRTLIANNLTYNNGGRGIHVFLSSHVDVCYNTIVGNGWALKNTNADLSIMYSRDIAAFSNIVVGRDTGIALQVDSVVGIEVSGNLLFNGAIPEPWRKNNVLADPGFAHGLDNSGKPPDFRLTAASPALDHAVSRIVIEEDFRGLRRPQGRAADIGAFERADGDP